MNRLICLAVLTGMFFLLLFQSPCRATIIGPVQWNIDNGGNGHYYEFIYPAVPTNWTTANTLASSRTFSGQTGHLVTVTSAAEDEFIFDTFGEQFTTEGTWTWIGLNDEVDEGKYKWVTGEEFLYTKWHASEPNNLTHGGQFPSGEDYIHYQFKNLLEWGWNDAVNSASMGYIVEYNNPVPEPNTLILSIFGLIGLGFYGRRR